MTAKSRSKMPDKPQTATRGKDAHKSAHGQAGTEAKIQGEGDYEAARRYDASAQAFAQSGKVDKAARDAKPASGGEDKAMRDAEQRGLAHSKGEDPALPHASRPAFEDLQD
jgi:hypothetical protein